MRAQPNARPFKRAGLHPLDCTNATCDGYVYATVAQLEALGLPACPCGSPYAPREVELAELLEVEDCAAVDEYRREVTDKQIELMHERDIWVRPDKG